MGCLIHRSIEMFGENRVKKDRDPIFMVCLIVFLIAAVAVLGVFVKDNYFPSSDSVASNGDSVSVEYTGTYYAYYGENGAVLFDTSYYSIANSGITKAHDFTLKSESSYSALTYTIGGSSVLKVFGDAAIGHKVGDKFRVCVDELNGYVSGESLVKASTTFTTSSSFLITKTQFSSLHSDITLTVGTSTTFESVYGWKGLATPTDDGNMVAVTYMVTSGSTYEVKDGDATLKFTVSNINSDGTFQCKLSIDGWKGQMVKTYVGTEVVYITEYDGNNVVYKTCGEKCNQKLYFEIELKSIN